MFGKWKENDEAFIVRSMKTNRTWFIEDGEELKNFFIGRNFEYYKVYDEDPERKHNIETYIYGKSGRFNKLEEKKDGTN